METRGIVYIGTETEGGKQMETIGKQMETIRILLVDDHQVVREGLSRMLQPETDMQVVGEAANMEEALAQAESLSPDIVLMDIKMPGTDGIEVTRRLKKMHPSCNVVMLTLYEDYLVQAIQAGATGFLLKGIKREELATAIRAIHLWRLVLFCNGNSPFALVKL